MRVSNETGMEFGTVTETKTDFQTEDFILKIVEGRGHFTTRYVFKPVCTTKSLGQLQTGYYWSEFGEAVQEGLKMLDKCQADFDEEILELKKKYQTE